MNSVSVKKKKFITLPTLFSIIQLLLFISATVGSLVSKPSALSYIALALTVVFAGFFILNTIKNIKDDKAAKQSVNDAKFAIKTTKNVAGLIELGMSLVTVATALIMSLDAYYNQGGGLKTVFTIIVAAFSLVNVLFGILRKILKMRKSAKKREAAQQKAIENEEKAEVRAQQSAERAAERKRVADAVKSAVSVKKKPDETKRK